MQFPIQVVLELIISYPSGSPAVQIGPGAQIIFYDTNGNIVTEFTPTLSAWVNEANTGIVQIIPNGAAGAGFFPGMYFLTANTPGVYAQPAWIQANPDASGNPQIGINNGLWTSASYPSLVLRQRIFLADSNIELGAIVAATQAPIGGQILTGDGNIEFDVYDGTSTRVNQLLINKTVSSSMLPIISGSWANVSFANGWSNFGAPYSGAQWRIMTDGTVLLRGMIKAGTVTSGTLMFAIPLAAQPPANKLLVCNSVSGVAAGAAYILCTVAGGQVEFIIEGTAPADISLDGLTYETSAYLA
jgi:hypothetical protein